MKQKLYDNENNISNEEKIDEDIKGSNIGMIINDIKENKMPKIDIKINEGKFSGEDGDIKLENNKQSSNPYDLPEDF